MYLQPALTWVLHQPSETCHMNLLCPDVASCSLDAPYCGAVEPAPPGVILPVDCWSTSRLPVEAWTAWCWLTLGRCGPGGSHGASLPWSCSEHPGRWADSRAGRGMCLARMHFVIRCFPPTAIKWPTGRAPN